MGVQFLFFYFGFYSRLKRRLPEWGVYIDICLEFKVKHIDSLSEMILKAFDNESVQNELNSSIKNYANEHASLLEYIKKIQRKISNPDKLDSAMDSIQEVFLPKHKAFVERVEAILEESKNVEKKKIQEEVNLLLNKES